MHIPNKLLNRVILVAALTVSGSLGHLLQAESLRNGDSLQITVFQEQSLSGVFPISSTGTISFPLLGRLPVAGKTADRIEAEIERLLEIDLIRDAEVAVTLASRETQYVKVIGDVRTPGQVSFAENGVLDLTTALASAGGLTEFADSYRIEVRQQGAKSGKMLSKSSGRNHSLRPGDTVIVHTKAKVKVAAKVVQTITILGEVKTPGTVELPDSGKIDLLTALAQAGGFTLRARASKVSIRRQSPTGGVNVTTLNVSKMRSRGEESFELRPGDVVDVPESIF